MKHGATVGLIWVSAVGLLVTGVANADGSTTPSGLDVAMQTSAMSTSKTNRFGGPVYEGDPALRLTAALLLAGGGSEDFTIETAFNNMLGEASVKAEIAKLTNQYGAEKVDDWTKLMRFYVHDMLRLALSMGFELPPPANFSGTELAKALIKAGTAPDGTFWIGLLFDRLVSHPNHNRLMAAADSTFGTAVNANAHAVANQGFYNIAQALGMKNVKLAPYH